MTCDCQKKGRCSRGLCAEETCVPVEESLAAGSANSVPIEKQRTCCGVDGSEALED